MTRSDRVLRWAYGAGLGLASWLYAKQRRRTRVARAVDSWNELLGEVENGLKDGMTKR